MSCKLMNGFNECVMPSPHIANRIEINSEGMGLSHEDERSYSGQILVSEEEEEEDSDGGDQTLFVRGSVVFGTDLGTDARPEPVGSFSMMEVRDDFEDVEDT